MNPKYVKRNEYVVCTEYTFDRLLFTLSDIFFQRLTALRIIDQYGRKRCQKKREDVSYRVASCL